MEMLNSCSGSTVIHIALFCICPCTFGANLWNDLSLDVTSALSLSVFQAVPPDFRSIAHIWTTYLTLHCHGCRNKAYYSGHVKPLWWLWSWRWWTAPAIYFQLIYDTSSAALIITIIILMTAMSVDHSVVFLSKLVVIFRCWCILCLIGLVKTAESSLRVSATKHQPVYGCSNGVCQTDWKLRWADEQLKPHDRLHQDNLLFKDQVQYFSSHLWLSFELTVTL